MKAFVIPSIFTAIDKFTGPVKGMGDALSKFSKKGEVEAAFLERRLRGISKAAFDVSGKAFLAGAAIATPLALAVNEARKFEDSLASFRTIVSDLSDKDFVKFNDKIQEIGQSQKRSFNDVASSFEKIAGLNAKFAETAEGIGAVSNAAITLSKASRMELGPSAESLVGIMNQFSFGAEEANRTINTLAAGQSAGAATIAQTAEAFVNFGSVAAGANLTLEQSVGLIQTLGKFSLFGSEAGTKLRGAILRIQKAGIGYASGQFQINDALEEANKKMGKLRTAKQKDAFLNKLFGAENIATGRILLNNIGSFNEFTKQVTGTSEAQKQAAINSATMNERLLQMRAQMQNLGVKIGTVLLPPLNKLLDRLIPLIDKTIKWAQANPGLMKTIVSITAGLAAFAFIVSGLAFVIGVVAKAQLIWNALMLANPIGLIIIGIVALIALITTIVAKWNEWGAALALFAGPLGLIISLIQSFRRNWDGIVNAFKNDGIISGLKAIGVTILDAILMPLQQVFKLLARVPGFGWAETAMNGIASFRNTLGANTTTDESGNPLAPKELVNTKSELSTKGAMSFLTIKDETGRASLEKGNNSVPIMLTSTVGFQ